MSTEEDIRAAAGALAAPAGTLGSALGDLANIASNVHYELQVQGVQAQWTVRSVHFEDSVSQLPSCVVEAVCSPGAVSDESELFSKDASVTIERDASRRNFRGIVNRASLRTE